MRHGVGFAVRGAATLFAGVTAGYVARSVTHDGPSTTLLTLAGAFAAVSGIAHLADTRRTRRIRAQRMAHDRANGHDAYPIVEPGFASAFARGFALLAAFSAGAWLGQVAAG